MKEKQFDPAGNNEQSPSKGMAAVDTHNPDAAQTHEQQNNLEPESDSREKVNNTNNDRQ